MIEKITAPTLVINQYQCRSNIREMLQKTVKSNSRLRPHFKTHQSEVVGKWFREEGVQAITVSSVSMAWQFAMDGWKDIMIAFPVNLREIDEINHLASRVKLGITLSSPGVAPLLEAVIKKPVDLYLKIDVGSHRTGFDPTHTDRIREALDGVKPNTNIRFKGFIAHAGHSYQAKDVPGIKKIFREGIQILKVLEAIFTPDYPDLIVSWGDTPTCSIADHFSGIHEIRAGNFVYYDLMQWQQGACHLEDIAMTMAAPVVALHPERNEVVIYGGAVHLSKESMLCPEGKPHYGMMVFYHPDGSWIFPDQQAWVRRVSQEHGIVQVTEEQMEKIKAGDLLGIVPVHACLTADLVRELYIF